MPATPPTCPFELRDRERHVARTSGAIFHFIGATPGHLWLTSERIVFQPVVPWPYWLFPPFGAVQYLIGRPRRRDLPLSEVASHERSRFGVNRNILLIRTKDLTPDLKVGINDYDAFATALATQLRV